MTCNIRVYCIVFNRSMHIVTCFHAFTPEIQSYNNNTNNNRIQSVLASVGQYAAIFCSCIASFFLFCYFVLFVCASLYPFVLL